LAVKTSVGRSTPSNLTLRQALFTGWSLLGMAAIGTLVTAAEGPRQSQTAPPVAAAAAEFKPMSEIRAEIRLDRAEMPADRSQELFQEPVPVHRVSLERWSWPDLEFWWAPTEFFHQPLYFDDVPLERYGQTRSRLLQPAISGLHFFGSVAVLPVKMLADHPCRCISQLGYDRPGSCTLPQRERLRFEVDPAWAEPGTCLRRWAH
jgi:hypothetical protein